ncbi:MAG TPA: MotA/TolQ/ExbB proton channel family protein [Planctomycetaceae bacterium]|nr:MotA/TolQ/ExbB proton channel family protein [Planctomycetaceae bacterium]
MTSANVRVKLNEPQAESADWLLVISKSPILWGGLATVGFYAAIPHLPVQREFAERYFCGHWILYSTTALFFVGLATLVIKALSLPGEKSAFNYQQFRDPRLQSDLEIGEKTDLILASLAALPSRARNSLLARRYRDVCRYLSARRASDTLEDHLKYLADLAADQLHDSYALLRTITWAIPILGFLGTVIGITMAIASITPDQLENSLQEVVAGLAVAFDTTALSLSLSMIVVFGMFLVERTETGLMSRVEEVALRDLVPLFPPTAQPEKGSPLEQAEAKAAEQLLQRTEGLINWQMDLWQKSLDGLRTRWNSTVEQQQTQFTSMLRAGMNASLNDHTQQLTTVRSEFLDGYRRIAEDVGRIVNELQQSSRSQQETVLKQAAALWDEFGEQLRQLRDEQREQSAELLKTIGGEVQGWQTELKSATETMGGQLHEIRRQGEILLRIVEQEEELARLQKTLADNIDAVRGANAFDETLHSLTAAVHLLTVRQQQHRNAA